MPAGCAVGVKPAADPVKRIMVNVGSAPCAPGCWWRPGKARCRLMGAGRGGVRVVVRGRESRSTWRRRTAGPQHQKPFGRSGVNTPAPLDVKSASERVLGWQTKLHRWAVQDEQERFGDLFNLICDPATLLVAWERVKRNRGSKTAGVDGQTRRRVEQLGVEKCPGRAPSGAQGRHLSPAAGARAEIPKRGPGSSEAWASPPCATGSFRWRRSSCWSRSSRRTSARPRTDSGPGVERRTPSRSAVLHQRPTVVRVGDRGRRRGLFRVDPSWIADGAGAPSGDRQARPGVDPTVPRRRCHARAWHPDRDAIGHATRVEYSRRSCRTLPSRYSTAASRRRGRHARTISAGVTGPRATPAIE